MTARLAWMIWPCLLLLPNLSATEPVDFENEIIPVLTKAGCNTGACHGAAVGRGGFKLSLYGGDPSADYESIVLELEGRRVNPARPDESLILLKPTETIAHGGGYRFDTSEPSGKLLRYWIEQGMPSKSVARLERVDITPKSQLLHATGGRFQLRAQAHYDDGTSRDVTGWTVFTAEDPSAVNVDSATAEVVVNRRGRHIIVGRYLDQVVPIEVLVPLTDEAVSVPSQPRSNLIDENVGSVLTTLRLPSSPPAEDLTLLRRVTLDLTGRLPKPELVRSFQKDADSDKRAKLVADLLQSDGFAEYWTLQLAKLLRIHTQPNDSEGARVYHEWLYTQIKSGTPYDQIAFQLICAEGDSHEYGPANFYRTVGGPREQAEFMSELFMGSRLRCANCHNHPLDRWTQDDYHGLAAIFAKVEGGKIVKQNPNGVVAHPRTGEDAVPRIPGGSFLAADSQARIELAKWLTHAENPFFSKAIVNRLWRAMMGRGLVEPADDLRATNPATHPQLLNRLAKEFVEHEYNLRHILQLIAMSDAYARSPDALEANTTDSQFYSHALRRPLEPEVLADAIADVIGVSERYGELPLGTRAVSLYDSSTQSPTLDILGRCSRTESCEAVTGGVGGLPKKLHLLNGQLLNRRLEDKNSRLNKMLRQAASNEQIIDEFYVRGLSRPPGPSERTFWLTQLQNASSEEARREMLEDFVWSLLTCNEFVTNH